MSKSFQISNQSISFHRPVFLGDANGTRAGRLVVHVFVRRFHSSFSHFFFQYLSESIFSDAAHERRRIWNADQPLQT